MPISFTRTPPATLTKGRVIEDRPGHGIRRIRMSTRITRMNRMQVCCYIMDGILIDTGFSHVGDLLLSKLENSEISLIACTHHHEDHTGNAARLARIHDCPVYMHNAHRFQSEGIVDMLFYRRWFWGPVAPYRPAELPHRIEHSGRKLVPIPIPGHSVTHVTYHEAETGVVFTGDLYVSGGATAVMSHENPYESIRSLRRVADLEPSLMLTGHGLAVKDPASRLREKADRIDEAAGRITELHGRGLSTRAIVRRVFDAGRPKDLVLAMLTEGEFSRANLVRACIRHAPS